MDIRARSQLRRAVLGATLTSFALAALLGIAALLGPGSFGETEIRVLLTTVVVGCGSLLALCCLAALAGRSQAIGVSGLLAVAGTTLFTLLLVWGGADTGSDAVFRAWGLCLTLTATLAQVCLLLGVAGRRTSLGPLMWATTALAAVLAGLVSAMILGWDGGDGAYRLVGVVAILDVLGTLVAIALAVFGGRDAPSADASALTIRLSPEVAGRLRDEAARSGRTVPDLVDEVMGRYLGSPAGD